MNDEEHHKNAVRSVCGAVITVSDTRTEATDDSGRLIQELLIGDGHTVCHYGIVKDEPAQIREQLVGLQSHKRSQAIFMTGGTGVSPRDRSHEVVASLIDKRLDGFGELFRMLSYGEIGPAAMLSRALAGVYGRQVIFCIPGSPNAVRLAMTRLILPELGHLVAQVQKP